MNFLEQHKYQRIFHFALQFKKYNKYWGKLFQKLTKNNNSVYLNLMINEFVNKTHPFQVGSFNILDLNFLPFTLVIILSDMLILFIVI